MFFWFGGFAWTFWGLRSPGEVFMSLVSFQRNGLSVIVTDLEVKAFPSLVRNLQGCIPIYRSYWISAGRLGFVVGQQSRYFFVHNTETEQYLTEAGWVFSKDGISSVTGILSQAIEAMKDWPVAVHPAYKYRDGTTRCLFYEHEREAYLAELHKLLVQ